MALLPGRLRPTTLRVMTSSRTLFILSVLLIAGNAFAQEPAAIKPIERPLRVFVDCRSGGCDQEFIRTELAWVDHVRDQKDADVHVLVTGQGTGGGGTEYTIRFIGHGQWDGEEDTLLRNTEAAATEDGRRRILVQAFAIGLSRFAAATPVGAKLMVSAPAVATQAAQTTAAQDPWNYWVFRTNFNLNLNGEATSKFANVNANQSANRTTAEWKANFNAGVSYNESEYDLGEGETFRSFRRGWNVNSLVVKSMGEHWSLGGKAGVQRSSFNNQKLNVRVAPGIEYNFFPYSKSTQRQLTVQWTAGINRFVYDEVTIFSKTEETKWDQAVMTSLDLRQPFGSIDVTVEAAHYFGDFGKYRLSIFANNELRVTRGLSLRFNGSYQVLHDQLYLRLGQASNEEIIARQRQLATGYRYFLFTGITYRFGSINNNVVNPRFGGGGDRGFF
ncbi:MAG: hypothetical protein Q7R30_20085 [Acidobacteriota bacterium]|nr:hypothetical protein [Acidobacteriota bacterium]